MSMEGKWISVTECEDTHPWNIVVDGFFRENVEKQMLADDMSLEAVDSVFSNAVRILSHCPNPNIQEELAERLSILVRSHVICRGFGSLAI